MAEPYNALSVLQNHPDRWIRPGNKERLLACLVLALRGVVIAVEDDDGFRFRLAQPLELSA